MIKGTTKSGFAYKIYEESLNDYELLEMISELDDNPLILPKVVNKILGSNQAKKLKEHIRDDKGFVNAEKFTYELTQIFNQKQLKN